MKNDSLYKIKDWQEAFPWQKENKNLKIWTLKFGTFG